MRKRSYVILMSVGGYARLHRPRRTATFEQPSEIGNHRLNTGEFITGEHPSAVKQYSSSGSFEDGAVASYLTEAAEKGNCDRCSQSQPLISADRVGRWRR